MFAKLDVLVLVCVLLTAEARYRNPYLTKLEIKQGTCHDCIVNLQVCGLKKPCKLNECEKTCITPNSGYKVDRKGTCDQAHQTDVFECLNDRACLKNQICCHTATGSYCN